MDVFKPKKLWHPELYHGHPRKSPFFEGWYYKLTDKKGTTSIAAIAAIFTDNHNRQSHASVQFLDNKNHKTLMQRYALTEVYMHKDRFDLSIGNNRFTLNDIKLDLHNQTHKVQGKCVFGDLRPWPVKWFSPGAMGWYAFVPFMQCYHAVLSFDHNIVGEFYLNQQRMLFDQGKGYMEKDWGTGFPRAYIWMQCNHFSRPRTSFMLSVAHIPWLGNAFRGVLAALLLDGKLYRFTTYTGAKTESLKIKNDRIHVKIRDKRYRLCVAAKKAKGATLYGPHGDRFGQHYFETLNSEITLSLTKQEQKSKLAIAEINGNPAALDINGEVDHLLI